MAEGDNLRKVISGVLLGLLFVALVAIPVLASYYANLTATEANGNDYDQLGMQFSLDVDYLADNGYITATGLDTRVTSGGTTLPHMMVDDRVLFTSDLEAYGSVNLLFETGNTALSNFDIVVGNGGYVTVADHANLELGNNFEIEFDGYVDTGVAGDLISKTDSFDVTTDGAGHVTAAIYGRADISQTNSDGVDVMHGAAVTIAGHRVDAVPSGYITGISFYLNKVGNPTGTAYIRVRTVSGDSILGTIGTLDASTLGVVQAWFDFTGSVFNPTTQDLRFTIEYSDGDAGNNVRVAFEAANSVDGLRTYYNAGWTDNAANDRSIKIYFDPIEVTADVTSGEHTITVTGDGADFKIYEDSVEEDSATVVPVIDNANDWVLGSEVIPYFTYTHTTSSIQRIEYAPDSIISGTTLPNEESPGTYDGAITFGSNPAGVTLALGGLVSEEQLLPGGGAAEFPETQEIAGETGQPGYTAGLATLPTHPFYPLVSVINAQTGIPIGIVWILGASFILAGLFVWMIGSHGMMHQMFIALAGGGWVAFCWHQGIYPFWVIFIYAVLTVAIVIGERSPTIS